MSEWAYKPRSKVRQSTLWGSLMPISVLLHNAMKERWGTSQPNPGSMTLSTGQTVTRWPAPSKVLVRLCPYKTLHSSLNWAITETLLVGSLRSLDLLPVSAPRLISFALVTNNQLKDRCVWGEIILSDFECECSMYFKFKLYGQTKHIF